MRTQFELGEIIITREAAERLVSTDVMAALRRHAAGDWGDVYPEEPLENRVCLDYGLAVQAVYRDSKGTEFHIYTEDDRTKTKVTLLDEY